MSEKLNKYWLLLSPKIYVNSKNDKCLLYNTDDGEYIETDSPACCKLISELQKSINLGVIRFDDIPGDDVEITNFITEAVQKGIFKLLPVEEGKPKPIVLLPVLNLQRDIDKLSGYGHEYFLGRDILHYLHQLNIYINGGCKLSCHDCKSYYKQFISCTKQHENNDLSPSDIHKILSEAQFSITKVVNLVGGNLYKYDHWDQLWDILDSFDFDFHIWINLENIPNDLLWTEKALYHTIETIITPDIAPALYEDKVSRFSDNPHVMFNYVVENEEHHCRAESLMHKVGMDRVKVIPFFNGSNHEFFEENIFLEQDDIFAEPISMRTIFCNQKLNSNFFGTLTVLPNGDVMGSMNNSIIGNIHQKPIIELIYKEILTKTSWRNVRGLGKCSECLYQYLCPPPSNYEIALGRENLCKIK